ncbi:SDR family oxidoreductase [Aestuariicella hydrocarbonica]|uniref:SDR family oxidoreductase n=1 Tax=Pseudomaricurvus hydrocarbonicus TaxID=1470433 RepID=A0A9E5MHM7_9GAMM|nr:SDR family oxidoreductase [Aestuariicella hydrocarbonica]NHO66141.1 SDR family oxidoreductase [Aestuariicella hydrocarbonica]
MGLLDGKTALVTGASRGLGRAMAELFASEGAAVAVLDLKEHWAQKVVDEIVEKGGRAIAIGADVSHRDSVREAFRATVQEFGAVDVVVNNAMWNRYEPIADIEPETVQRMLDVGFTGVVWAIQAAAEMMSEKGGSIINIASVSGVLGITNALTYCGVKAAVGGLTRSASVELGARKIRVNSIAPSTVATEGVKTMLSDEAFSDRVNKTPLKRLGEVEDIAQAALWLASDNSSFVTGQTLTVDGGLAHAF